MNALIGRVMLLTVLTGGTGLLCKTSPPLQGGQQSGVSMQLPKTIPGMVSDRREPDETEKKMLPADTEFSKAVFYTPATAVSQRDVVQFEIVLSGAERRSIHRPEVCLQGQGWTLLESSRRKIKIQGHELAVTDLYISKDEMRNDGSRKTIRAHFFYWFIGHDVTTPGHLGRLWLTFRDNIMRGINHRWAYASALALVTENLAPQESGERYRSSEETVALLENFTALLAPRFQKSFMDNPPVAAAH